MSPHLHHWLHAVRLRNIGPRKFLRMYQEFSDIAALFSASEEEWRAVNIPEKYWEILRARDDAAISRDLKWCENKNHHIICLDDSEYPMQLKEIADPPLVLYVQGDKTALQAMQFAIVGARNATTNGVKNAEIFAKAIVQAGFAITSGLALGIDGASHRAALAGGGVTLGISGAGLNHIYPLSHRALYEEMIEKRGAVVSEFSLDVPVHPMNFPRRNRIIAGLSRGVLVVEAAIKSGSLITARLASEYGREVFAIPGSIHQTLSRGCHHLIRQGAILVEKVEDILDELQLPNLSKKVQESVDLAPREQQVLNYIKYEITPIDMIVLLSGLTAGELSSILLTLELKGQIETVPGGYIRV